MVKPWCTNCRIELPSPNAKNSSTERLTEFISYHEGYEVKVTIKEAIATIFECGLKLNNMEIPDTRLVEMCSQCTAVLAELYRFYIEFMKLTREASYMQQLLQQSTLWEFGRSGLDGAGVEERDSKKHIFKNLTGMTGDAAALLELLHPSTTTRTTTIPADLTPKVQLHEPEPGEDEEEEYEEEEQVVQGDDGDGMIELSMLSFPDNELPTTTAFSGNISSLTSSQADLNRIVAAKKRSSKFPCPLCSKEFARMADTRRHVKVVHGGAAAAVQESDRDYLPKRKSTAPPRPPSSAPPPPSATRISSTFKCDQCDKTFRRKDNLKTHQRSHHTAPPPPTTKQQPPTPSSAPAAPPPKFPKRPSKSSTSSTTSAAAATAATTPGAAEHQRQTLSRLHKRSKARKPMKKKQQRKKFNYRCTDCNLSFPTRETMKYHRRKLHPKNSFSCSNCPRLFHSENELRIHENVKHGIGEKLQDRLCPIPGCGKYFALPNIMKRHVQSVHCEDKDRIYSCPFCPLKFPIKNRLDTHLKNRHNSDNSLQTLRCEHCGRVYETRSGLAQHIETVHTNLKVYACEICGRTSIRPEWLKKHMELHDSSREKKFQCPQCDMKFYRNASLKKHQKNHSGAKNYLCAECGDKFRQTSSLRRHIEAKHSLKNGPFTCDQCGKSFKIKEYLAQHLRAKSHGGRGHGLYTPAGKRRLQREMEQQQQQQLLLHHQQQDDDIPELGATSSSMEQEEGSLELKDFEEHVHVLTTEGLHQHMNNTSSSAQEEVGMQLDLKGPTQQLLIPTLSGADLELKDVRQQLIIQQHGTRIVLIGHPQAHHQLVGAAASGDGSSASSSSIIHHQGQAVGGERLNVVELVVSEGGQESSTTASSYTTTGSATSTTSQLPVTPFQGTPIQFLATVNPAWFQQQTPTSTNNSPFFQ